MTTVLEPLLKKNRKAYIPFLCMPLEFTDFVGQLLDSEVKTRQ